MKVRQAVSSLHARVAVVILLVVAPPFGALLLTAAAWHRHETAEAESGAERLARHASFIHDRLLREAEQFLLSLAQTTAVVEPERETERGALPVGFPDVFSSHTRAGVVGREGTVRWLDARGVTQDGRMAANLVVAGARSTKKCAVGDYEFDHATGRSAIVLACPANGPVPVPVAFAVIDSVWLRELSTELEFPPGTDVSILDRRGTVVGHDSNPGRPAGKADHVDVRRVLDGRAEDPDRTGSEVPRYYGVAPLRTGSGNYVIAVGVPRAASAGEVDAAVYWLLRGFAVSLLFALVITPLGVRWSVTGPLDALAEATRRVSRRELGTRTRLRRAPREVTVLAEAFDEMAETLEKRDAEVALQTELLTAQERRFRALIENATDGFVLVDEEGRARYVSPSTTRLLGYTAGELIGQSVFGHIHPDDAETQLRLFVEVMTTAGTSVQTRFRLQHKDGSWRWVEAIATNLLHDPAVRALVANYRDITARLEAQEALERAHTELERRVEARTIDLMNANEALQAQIAERIIIEQSLTKLWRAVEQTTDCVFLTDRRGTIEYVNPAFERVTGYSLKEAIGAKPSIIQSGEHDRRFYERLWHTIMSGQVFRAVFVNRTKDGQLYYEDRTITPLRDAEGTITHFVSTGRDITKIRRTEQALRRLNQRLEHEASRIAGVLHDEAGQFLTSAHITLADVSRELPEDARVRLKLVRDNLDEVEAQLRRLAHELRPRILDDLGLVEALRFLVDGVRRRAGLEISLEASVRDRCCPTAETAIYRLVQEGLTNVTRHARASRVTVVITQDEWSVDCTVADDGVGFDVEENARRGQSSLGLQGIQDRLEAVNGVLEITSTPGAGTTLRAIVPLET